MPTSLKPNGATCQDDPGSLVNLGQGKDLSLVAECVRLAIDQTDWKHAAIAKLLDVSEQYLARMLSTEKPISARHIAALPPDARARYAKLYAEAHGLVVVEPITHAEGVRALVTGLVSVLAARHDLPARFNVAVKAESTPMRRSTDRKAAI